MFTVHICTYHGKYFWFAFVKTGGREIAKGLVGDNMDNDNHLCNAVSAITMVAKGEGDWFKCTSSNGSTSVRYTDSLRIIRSFPGSLLQTMQFDQFSI